MTYEEVIRQERPQMSKSFAKLADFLLDSYVEAAFMTASELAQALNLDAATVVRFSQHLGYPGFPKLQREIRQRVKKDLLIRPTQVLEENTPPGITSTAIKEVLQALDQTRISLDTEALYQLVEEIGKARRVVILPEGPAQPTAYSLVLFLEQGGFPVYIARTGLADLARTVNNATQQDLLIALEVAGQSPYIARAMGEARIKRNSDCSDRRGCLTAIRPLCQNCPGCPISSIDWGWDYRHRYDGLCDFSSAALAVRRSLRWNRTSNC